MTMLHLKTFSKNTLMKPEKKTKKHTFFKYELQLSNSGKKEFNQDKTNLSYFNNQTLSDLKHL